MRFKKIYRLIVFLLLTMLLWGQIAAREEHVYIEEGTGDFDPMVAGVCCAEELVLDDGDNASCVGAVDDKADEDDAESRPTKRAKL